MSDADRGGEDVNRRFSSSMLPGFSAAILAKASGEQVVEDLVESSKRLTGDEELRKMTRKRLS